MRPGNRAGSPRFSVANFGVLAALALFIGLAAYRAALVDDTLGRYVGCSRCLGGSVLANDALLASAWMAMLSACRSTRLVALRIPLAIVAAGAVIAYGADLVVFRLLIHRLHMGDAVRFGGDPGALLSVLGPWLQTREAWMLVSGVVVAAVATVLALAAGPARWSHAVAWALCAAAISVAAEAVPRVDYLHEAAVKNLWQVNRELDPRRAYSDGFRRSLGAQPRDEPACEPGMMEDLSVVLVVAESLSATHSRIVGGLRDFTPELDALAGEGSSFPEFLANGYSTEGGLIALLTGQVPIESAGRFGTTMAYTDVESDFHRRLRERGYLTAFFTNGALTFGQQGEWARAIGIAHVEGAEHPYFDGMPRGVFGAARDAALVDRFLQWHSSLDPGARFMATVLTVEAHPPYADPGTGGVDEEAKIRESDRQIARLARSLQARGFFERGVMFVVGDHRAMTPISPEERDRLGPHAAVRVLALALGRTGLAHGAVPGRFQQVELLASLRYLIDAQSCRMPWRGRFLGAGAAPARYALYSDPVRRNEVVVLDDGRNYRLLLDGDDTRWLVAPADAAEADHLRNEINWQRIVRMVEFRP